MAEVNCSRCGSAGAGLDESPLPGEVGRAVLAQTCAGCWGEWLRAQVMLINEYRLSPADPEHFDRLLVEMKKFLNLREESES